MANIQDTRDHLAMVWHLVRLYRRRGQTNKADRLFDDWKHLLTGPKMTRVTPRP
jgi:hypothetical protein